MTVSRRRFVQLGALSALPLAGCRNSSAGRGPSPLGSTATTTQTTTHASVIPGTGTPRTQPSRPPGAPAAEVGNGPRDVNAVALTFHGAGDRAIARAVLAELGLARTHVTVLAVGSWLDADPATVRRVLADGHELGNHTQNHRPMGSMGAREAYGEIIACASGLRRLTGSSGRWFRASGTQHTTPAIRAAAGRAGYPTCLSYDVDSLDFTDPGSAAVVHNVESAVRAGSIISLHLGHKGTVAAIAPLVAALQAQGLRPVLVSELLA